MTDESKDLVKQAIRHFRLPAYEEITDVGLYLDQTTRYINEYMFPLSEDMEITSSMISNYVKRGLVANPVRKQYSRDQIALLIGITMAKTILSLDHIDLFIHVDMEMEGKAFYNFFRDELNISLQDVFGFEKRPETEVVYTDNQLLVHNLTIAIAYKIYIDVCCKAISQESGAPLAPKKQKKPKQPKQPKQHKGKETKTEPLEPDITQEA